MISKPCISKSSSKMLDINLFVFQSKYSVFLFKLSKQLKELFPSLKCVQNSCGFDAESFQLVNLVLNFCLVEVHLIFLVDSNYCLFLLELSKLKLKSYKIILI